jgi:hypothetical protein
MKNGWMRLFKRNNCKTCKKFLLSAGSGLQLVTVWFFKRFFVFGTILDSFAGNVCGPKICRFLAGLGKV